MRMKHRTYHINTLHYTILHSQTFEQIDIAATLSVLLGLPIPSNSIGTLIGPLLGPLTMEQQLYALHYNGQRLVSMLAHKSGGMRIIENREFCVQFREAVGLHADWLQNRNDVDAMIVANRARFLYESSARAISETLAISFVNYDQWSIGVGLVWTSAVSIIIKGALICKFTIRLFIFSKTLLVLIINAMQFPRPAIITIHIATAKLLIGSITIAAIQATFVENPAIFNILSSLAITFVGLCLWSIASQLYELSKPHIIIHRMLANFHDDDEKDDINVAIQIHRHQAIEPILASMAVGTIVHAALLASSSFVEEEHQTWYCLCTTALLMLAIRDVRSMMQHSPMHRLTMPIVSWLTVFVAMAIVRRLNQTGDKWLSVPDVGDWLVMASHRDWLSVWTATGENGNAI